MSVSPERPTASKTGDSPGPRKLEMMRTERTFDSDERVSGLYALIQKLRTLEAERGWSIPALAVTAYARAEDRTRALSSGFQMHVAKPLEPADLVAAITRLLGKDRGAATVGT